MTLGYSRQPWIRRKLFLLCVYLFVWGGGGGGYAQILCNAYPSLRQIKNELCSYNIARHFIEGCLLSRQT